MLTSGSITTAVDRAQKKGFVNRVRDPSDGRIVNVTLTEEGRDFITSTFDTHAIHLDRLFNTLNKEEKTDLARLLKKIGKAAELMSL